MDEAKETTPETVTVTRVDSLGLPKKGFLGIGKKPGRYQVRFYQPAIVEITYKQKARLQVAIGSGDAMAKKVKCERCAKFVDFIVPVQLVVRGTGQSSAVVKVCAECMIKFSSGAEQTSFAPSAAPPSAADEMNALISELGRRDLLGPNPAFVKLQQKGAAAVHYLLKALDSNDVNTVVDAIHLLKEMRAKEAIPKLSALSKSKWAEVHQAALIALAVLDEKPRTGLQFDHNAPYEQIVKFWTTIVQGRQMLYPAPELQSWCAQAIEALPSVQFQSKEQQAKAWGMTGSLAYKANNPDWPGGFDGTAPCNQAKRCYEEAVRAEPKDSWWQDWVKRFS